MLSLTEPSDRQDRTAALIARFEAERSPACTTPGCVHTHPHAGESARVGRRNRSTDRAAALAA